MKKLLQKNQKNNLIYAAIMLIVFAVFSLAYNAPVITGGMALSQPDIINYKGSAEEMLQYQKQTGENIYWSDAMFGGMPTYQTGASYDGYWVKKVDEIFRFLPRPADYLFILLGGFFFLGFVLFRNWKYAALSAFLFGLGTYFFIVIEAGHNAKVHAIAYFAPFMAALILIFRKKYIIGFLLATLFMALELLASHPQMTYYFGFVVLFYFIAEFFEALKNHSIRDYFIKSLLAISSVVLAFGMNSSPLMATQEYTQFSTRGENDVTLFEDSNPSGLDKSYITHWSYGKLETLNLWIPNFMGGGSVADEESKPNLKKALENNVRSPEEYDYYQQYLYYLPTYWGDQPFTSGPAYQGAIVVFLFLLGCIIVPGKWKWWLLGSTFFSIFLSWGKNMMWLTDIFIDYVPLYDKFRAVSSILVIAEFTMPLLAAFAIYYIFKKEFLKPLEIYKKTLYVSLGTLGILLILYFVGANLFSFATPVEAQLPTFVANGIRADRVALFQADTLRTFIFVALAAGLILAYLKKYIKSKEIVIAGIAVLTIIDLWGVNKRYLNNEDFIPKQWVENPFPTEVSQRLLNEAQKGSPALMQIAHKIPVNHLLNELKKQNPGHYRVFNTISSTFNETQTSYFLPSLGGYHGAKLQNYQNVIDLYFSNDSIQMKKLGILSGRENILNLLNTKFVVVGGAQKPQLIQNPAVAGNAWFVSQVLPQESADSALVKIGKIDIKNVAVAGAKALKFSNENAEINLKSYHPMKLSYESRNEQSGYAVFSEIYYPKGWKAYINGEEVEILQTNYFLRGLEIPAGTNQIDFVFEPQVIQRGKTMMLASNIIFILLVLGGIFYHWKNFRSKKDDEIEISKN
ncbi:Predicted membrane protein [Candidatus Ornithobacterium hominis]|uniref:Predicted membrane protein n=1 Tax=Candidatus Ornithobacterium hominis TaxID=2497989 RepID=A0A383U0A8_9FLAO|nr:YfhO family protein [Candidatus Ornithobacterium hominis]MCT7904216.1 YfhO family protein [Candidatus Ornithobacterium hominis]SZD72879.1 Predicted membrane protein [Candidatus Ornithobacterium hominis]